ncbi:MAG: hypothetical protein M1814_002168 [Vezdaea aestivalis]|nr:MAG: hypothetical protein M1814_002168 [Vezdaea aestivalis]
MSISNVRAFVQWKQDTVYAGEAVECTITFKNICPVPGIGRSGSRKGKPNSSLRTGERQRRTIPSAGSQSSPQSSRVPAITERHRPIPSLNAPVGPVKAAEATFGSTGQNGHKDAGHSHKRSVSIISMGSTEGVGEDQQSQSGSPVARRNQRAHTRSASLQTVSRRPGIPSGLNIPSLSTRAYLHRAYRAKKFTGHGSSRSATQPSPLFHASTPPAQPESLSAKDFSFPTNHSRRSSGLVTVAGTPGVSRGARSSSGSLSQTFKFPQGPLTQGLAPDSPRHPPQHRGPARSPSPRSPIDGPGFEHLPPVTRILSGSSMNGGTPRSSTEFYSQSNHSSETLASEYQSQIPQYPMFRPNHLRRQSLLTSSTQQRSPETLMMGYAQVVGTFILDGSLVNQGTFEEIKRKGVVGGQGGGGVVGVETNKRDSGLLGAFGWGTIGTSFGDLLGGGELSTVKEMRGIASSKKIPLLSTPQSILFVDLRLSPGESKTYSYKFQLPKGLPPTHKGRAIKVSYNLIIGTQKAGTVKDRQQMRQVDVPFRVFGSVNSRGETLGHDLRSPYILLKDQAMTKSVDDLAVALEQSGVSNSQRRGLKRASGQEDFRNYVDALLSDAAQNSSTGLLSPTIQDRGRRQSEIENPLSIRESIDLAILRSNLANSANRSSNRFEIARNGRRVAVVMLARPAYRLGETITAIVDFEGAEIPCYSIYATLESVEKVDGAIALRSSASIDRVTKKIHASHSESALYARRVTFSPAIPVSTTPEFITSGVSLEWRIRIEFVTPHIDGDGAEEDGEALLEEVDRDNRGVILAAVEDLQCASFDVEVPIRVFGLVPEGEGNMVGGLVV